MMRIRRLARGDCLVFRNMAKGCPFGSPAIRRRLCAVTGQKS
jgi:hypothetical protein